MNRSIALILLTASATAFATPAQVAHLKQETELQAQAAISDLFRVLCPEQCVLVSVEARVEEENVTSPAPGFEGLTGAGKLPALRGVTTHVLFDDQLPGAFRTRLKNLINQRLSPFSPTNTVAVDTVAFPPRNAPHLEAPEKPDPLPAQLPPEPVVDPKTPMQRLMDNMIEAAPLLIVVLLLSLTLIFLATLLMVAFRRSTQPQKEEEAPDTDEALAEEQLLAQEEEALVEQTDEGTQPAQLSAEFPPERLKRLERALHEERSVRNAVVRQALKNGDVKPVAVWTREFGDFVLEDLRGDPAIAPGVALLANELMRPEPIDPQTRTAAMFDLDGRVIGARLAESVDPTGQAFAFLEGISTDRFVGAVRELSPSALDVAVRFAPTRLRSAALDSLPSAQRAELALSLARRPEVSTSYAITVAEELRAKVLDTASGESQVDRIMSEVLDTLPMSDQDKLVERLRSEGNVEVARGVITESSLSGTPVEILSAALLSLPPARLVSYLSGAESTLRDHVISACPKRLRGELQEELGLRGTGSREEFFAARRDLLSSLRTEFNRRGLSPGDLRGPAARTNGEIV